MRLLAFLRLCLLLSGLVSCDAINTLLEKSDHYNGVEVTRIRKGTPIIFERADPACDQSKAVSDLRDESGNIKVWVGQHGLVSLATVHLPEVSGHGLESEMIADTLIGHEMSYDHNCFTRQNGERVCEDVKNTVRKQGQRLYFCKKGGDYPRDSLENVALASLVGIVKTHSVHKSVFPGEKLNKITLLVHPLIIDHHCIDNREIRDSVSQETEQVRTDNAFWFPNKTGDYIAAVPDSVERKPFKNIQQPSFWEMPSIISHEYGHHIFNHSAPSLVDQMGSDLLTNSLYLKRATSAINEGFADLIAYLTFLLEGSEFGWFTLDNVYWNREVSQAKWSDGNPKKLDEWFLFHYFNQTSNLPRNPHSPDPTDNHAVGAVFAHGLFRSFRAKQSSELESVERLKNSYRQTVEWGHRLEAHFESDAQEHPNIFLERTIQHGLSSIENEENFLGERCSILNDVFPVFPELARVYQCK